MKEKGRTKIIKRALAIAWWTVIVLLALCIVKIVSAKVKGKVPKLFGYSILRIVSGSMETEIPEGSYILVKEVAAKDIETGDVICFYSTDPQIFGMPNTHRVVETIEGEAGIEFVTKGDANLLNDKTNAHERHLVGRYEKTLTGLTAFARFLDGKGMFVLLIAVQFAACSIAVYTFVVKAKGGETDEGKSPPITAEGGGEPKYKETETPIDGDERKE